MRANHAEGCTGEFEMNKRNKGFTLVEIMIVVLIIGILAAIAIPNFLNARTTSQTKSCIANLKQLESGKEQWAMANGKGATDSPASTDLAPTYIKVYPACPASGTYTIGNMTTRPVCTVAGHVLP
jgi:prepilin-type N-terminal cleavage/methylation domain-containing protein